jgi:hypothetical protein
VGPWSAATRAWHPHISINGEEKHDVRRFPTHLPEECRRGLSMTSAGSLTATTRHAAEPAAIDSVILFEQFTEGYHT